MAKGARHYGVRKDGEIVWEGGCRNCARKIADEIQARHPESRVMVVNRG